MSPVDDVLSDLDAAIADFTSAAGSPESERRALRTALACIYELRAYREDPDDEAMRKAYYNRADQSDSGRITEGLIWIRGKMTHRLIIRQEPDRRPLLPGSGVLTGDDTLVGSNVVWRTASEVANLPSRKGELPKLRQGYEWYVAGQPVLRGLRAARKFLASDPGPCL